MIPFLAQDLAELVRNMDRFIKTSIIEDAHTMQILTLRTGKF